MQSPEFAEFMSIFAPEDQERALEVQRSFLELEDEELADLSDVLDAALEDVEVRLELEDQLDIELSEEALFLMNALVKDLLPQTEGFMPREGAPERAALAAGGIASLGRHGDTMLAHITPGEAQLLRSRGGAGTVNPYTGNPEFFVKKIKSAVKKVGSAIKKAAPTILALGGAFTGNPYLAALGAGLGAKVGGASWKDSLKSAALAGGTTAALRGAQGVFAGGEGTVAQRFGAGVRESLGESPVSVLRDLGARTAAGAGEGVSPEASRLEAIDPQSIPGRIDRMPSQPTGLLGRAREAYDTYISPSRPAAADAGAIRRYAPLAAAGLGAAYLTGGFEEEPAQPPLYDPNQDWWPQRQEELASLYGPDWSTPGFMLQGGAAPQLPQYAPTPQRAPNYMQSPYTTSPQLPPPVAFTLPEEDARRGLLMEQLRLGQV